MDNHSHRAHGNQLTFTMKNTKSRHEGSISSKNVPMYHNVTGPGDYDLPGFA